MSMDILAETKRAEFIDKIAENIRKNIAKYQKEIQLEENPNKKEGLLTYLEIFNIDVEDAFNMLKEEVDYNNEAQRKMREEPTSHNLKVKIREIIKAREQETINTITYEELRDKLQATNKDIGDIDIEEQLKRLLEDGEIYEPRPDKFRWLG